MVAPPSVFADHKLLQHLDRLAEWKATGDTIPVMVGLDLTNVCNHRCPGCVGSMGLDTTAIPLADLNRLIAEFAHVGVKAVSLAGGGDPTCHPNLAEVLYMIRDAGMEIGMFTNGQVMHDDVVRAIVECCTWIRISLDADSPEMHAKVHGVRPDSFQKVLHNISRLLLDRTNRRSEVTIGTSYLVGPHTIDGIANACSMVRNLGVDYMRIRPFFSWDGRSPFSSDEAEAVMKQLKLCAMLERPGFHVSYPRMRTEWISVGGRGKRFDECNVHCFVTIVTADMKVYLCCHLRNLEKYCFGDLSKDSFSSIWASERRRRVCANIDFSDCATPCVMSCHNELLDELATPATHANFL